MRNKLPEEKGFSERNIKRMLAFSREYPHLQKAIIIVQVGQIYSGGNKKASLY